MGAYFMNMKILADEQMHESEMATGSNQTNVQQLPWWKQWQHIYLTPTRGCKMGHIDSNNRLSLGNQATHNNVKDDDHAKQQRCFM